LYGAIVAHAEKSSVIEIMAKVLAFDRIKVDIEKILIGYAPQYWFFYSIALVIMSTRLQILQ
jgi:hypothetical protein